MESGETSSRDTISFVFFPCIGTLWMVSTSRWGLCILIIMRLMIDTEVSLSEVPMRLSRCVSCYDFFYLVHPASFVFYSLHMIFQCKKKNCKESVSGPRRRSHRVRCCRQERRVEVVEEVVWHLYCSRLYATLIFHISMYIYIYIIILLYIILLNLQLV